MSQNKLPTIVPTVDTGTTLSNALNIWADAIETSQSGATAPAAPAAGNVWYDTTANALKIYDGTGWVEIAEKGKSSTTSATPPATPTAGTTWFDNSTGNNILKVYDGAKWVTLGSTTHTAAPASPYAGQLWFDSSTGVKALKIYDGTNWKTLADISALSAAVNYRGAKDVTAAIGAYTPATGDMVVANSAGTVHASWTGAAGQTLDIGDALLYDGTNWDVLLSSAELNNAILKTTASATSNTITSSDPTHTALTLTGAAGQTQYVLNVDGNANLNGNIGVGWAPQSDKGLLVAKGGKVGALIGNSGTSDTLTLNRRGTALDTHYFIRGYSNSTNTYSTAGGTVNFSVNDKGDGYFAGDVKIDGDIWAAGISATAGNAITSDIRMKKDWRDGSHDLSALDGIETGHFKFIHHDNDLEHYGFKAQSLPAECQYLTDQIIPEYEDLYYDDVEVTEDVPLEEGDDDFGSEEPQTKTVTRTEKQRNDVPFDDDHRVIAVNVGAVLAKTVEHNKLLKAELDSLKSDFEARLAALESA